ncbi:hypothetical protein HYU23_04185 [Candidatus Woesearchaeota archaeon]|nr:hypothetical protein [Candidatus Woesearchaeota archaeon]
MDWKECCSKRIVKDIKLDVAMINSLIESSKNKLESESILEMSKITASSKVSLVYDSLRELLEAIAIKKGYKIYNHECYTAFLKEILKDSNKGDKFDEIRKIRNDINYYGKKVLPEEAKEVILNIKNLINNLEKCL